MTMPRSRSPRRPDGLRSGPAPTLTMSSAAESGEGDAGLAAEVAPRESDPRAARKKAMDLLARREYGREELIGRVTGAGFEHDIAIQAVGALADEGLQDDGRFASSFLTAKAGRGAGPLRIRQALREKGLKDAAIDQAFAGNDTDWYAMARAVRHKKFGTAVPEAYADKAKQMRFLNYRGFDYDHIDAAFAADPEA